MSAISRVTRAATETQRVDRGENRIPAVWRARVVYVRESTADCGHRPGVYVTVPNFTRGEIHGPVQVVGDTPAEGDMVVAVAVEGRKNDWIIITGGGVAEVEERVGLLESRLLELGGDVDDLADLLTSKHGETVNAIGILETQIEVIEGALDLLSAGLDPDPAPIPLLEPFEARRSPTWRVRGRVLELAGMIRNNDFSGLIQTIAHFPDDWPRPSEHRVFEKLVLNAGEAMGVTIGAHEDGRLIFHVNPLGVSGSTANFHGSATFSLDGVTLPLW